MPKFQPNLPIGITKTKKMRVKKGKLAAGYTLVELIVAIGLLGILAVSATNLFFSAIRGSSKVDAGTEVKQNGQFALSAMEQLIRNSLTLNSCTGTNINITSRDGKEIIFACVDVGAGSGYIASNSARLTSENVVVTSCSFACSEDVTKLRSPLVTVTFTIQQKAAGVETYQRAAADFSTSVSLRSY